MDMKIVLVMCIVVLGITGAESDNENVTLTDQKSAPTDGEFKTYQEAEKEITDFINSFLRSLLPKIVGGSSGAKISPKCTASMMKIFGNIRKLKGWTLKMLDSIGKPTSGILKGKSYSMGHYDQCLDISVTSRGLDSTVISEEFFRGQYCKVRVKFPEAVVKTAADYHEGLINETALGRLKEFIQAASYVPGTSEYMNHFFGLCLPSLCTLDDVQQMVEVISFPGSARVERCEYKTEIKYDYTQSAIIGIFLFLICLVCIGTAVDCISKHRKQNKEEIGDNKCLSICISFSACKNTKRLMSKIEEECDAPERCIRGIFATSVVWFIIGNTYLMPYRVFYEQASSLENLNHYLSEKTFSFIVSFPLAVDAMFMCYGFLMTYRIWHSSSKTQNVNVNVGRLILEQYIRLCFPLIFCLGIVFLLPLLGSGPFWSDALDDTIRKCRSSVWTYIGIYGNFLDVDDQCLPHLWFVPCLMQITVIGGIISWILSKNIKIGVFLILLVTISSNLGVGIVTVANKLPPAHVMYFTTKASDIFWEINYSLPLSHFGPFAIGMVLGIVVARRVLCRIKPILACICWIISISGICCMVLTLYYYRKNGMSSIVSAVYAGNHRTIFGLCVAWIMMACSFGYGGFVANILSWRMLVPVFRLSYFAYLLHFIVLLFAVGSAREQFHYSHSILILKSIGYICVTYILSYICSLMLELPLSSLQSVCCQSRCKEIKISPISGTLPKALRLNDINSKNNCKLWSVNTSKNGEYLQES